MRDNTILEGWERGRWYRGELILIMFRYLVPSTTSVAVRCSVVFSDSLLFLDIVFFCGSHVFALRLLT